MISRAIPYLYALWFAVVSLLAACDAAAADDRRAFSTLTAKAVAEPAAIDGSLNDPQWQGVQAAAGFVQREPAVGASASVKMTYLFAA